MPPKDVGGIGGWFLGNMQEVHVGFLHFAAAFAVITGRAGRHQVCPNMLATHVAWNDMIHSKRPISFPAILTGIIIATEYFAAR